jgi:hypothetical protein
VRFHKRSMRRKDSRRRLSSSPASSLLLLPSDASSLSQLVHSHCSHRQERDETELQASRVQLAGR